MRPLFQDMSLARRGSEPLYVRLAAAIRDRIRAGGLGPGDRLPPVRAAALALHLNVNTVQRAYNLLARESVLSSRRGVGTVVLRVEARPGSRGSPRLASSLLSARNQLQGTVRAIEVSGVMAEVVLDLPSGQQIVAAITRASVERLRLRVGQPATAIIKSTDVMLAQEPVAD